MALIISLSEFFTSTTHAPAENAFKVTNASHGICIAENDLLIYGDVSPFNGGDKKKYLRFLGGNNNSDEFDLSDTGEYAVVCLNRNKRRIVLSKDYSGTRNIYYAVENGKLFLSTNVYDVLSKLDTRKFDISTCLEYLLFEYIGAPRTLFAGIASLKHGSTVILDHTGAVTREIDSIALSAIKEYLPNDWARGLREKIITAHSRRLGSRNGIYLSGGIDSSVMAITLKKDLSVDDLMGVTFSTKNAVHDESGHAIQAAKELGIDLEKVIVDPNRPVDLPSLIEHSSYPYVGCLILSAVGEQLKSRGLADVNLYAGQDSRVHTPPYNPIDNIVLNRFSNMQITRNTIAKMAGIFVNVIHEGKIGKGLERLAHASDLSLYVQRYFQHFHRKTEIPLGEQYGHLWQRLNEQISCKLSSSRTALSIANSIFDISWDRQYGCDMDYMIKNTEAFGGSASMPFYDRDFNQFSAALPLSLKMKLTVGRAGHTGARKAVNKYALREAFKGELSDGLVYRDKAVCITNHMYLNGSLSPYIRDYLKKPRLKEIGIMDHLGLDELVRKAIIRDGSWKMSEYDEVVEIQNLLFLETIARKFDVIYDM